MRNNNLSNNLIKLCVVAADFLILWLITYLFIHVIEILPKYWEWDDNKERLFWLAGTVSLMIAEYFFSSLINERNIGADDILRRSTLLAATYTLTNYLLLRAIRFLVRLGWQLLIIGLAFLVVIIIVRLLERWILKKLREKGYNTRYVTLVGSDRELQRLYQGMTQYASWGYKVKGYYGSMDNMTSQGSVSDFVRLLDDPDNLKLGDELYLCISRKDKEVIERIEKICDQKVVKFYYVPIAEELLNLEPTMFGHLQLFTTYVSPLEDPLNRIIKRLSDVLMSLVFLIPTALLFPIVACIIKIQSPGPIFFRQRRTGLDGKEFEMIKFRSMHVNEDADKVQATENDPRKFGFGTFMRKSNIDELPQFWNVLRGDMSIVGPRPHMLAHTMQYSQLIDKYMVRHFVKPGITGWAQVTGFRGETKEKWQMEGRVERDIWYIQNWTIWIDLRIIWMTVKTIFKHDEKAY